MSHSACDESGPLLTAVLEFKRLCSSKVGSDCEVLSTGIWFLPYAGFASHFSLAFL